MFRLLDRYLAINIVAGMLLVLLVLLSLDLFFTFMNELDDVGRGNYDYLQALWYVLLSTPQRLYEYVPTATLIGGLLGLGSLAGNGEITAMRAAGQSAVGVAISVLKMGSIIVLVVFMLGEWVTPGTSQMAEKIRAEALQKQLSIHQQGGLWIRHNSRFIHAGKVVNREHLSNLQVFEFDGSVLATVYKIAQAQRKDGRWHLKQLQEIRVQEDKISRKTQPEAEWDELVPTSMLDVLRVSPEQMAAVDLKQYIQYLEDNELQSSQYQLAFWNRFVQPLTILVMLLLALPFVFASQRSGGAGQRIFIGVMLGIGFYLLNRMLNQIGIVYGLPALASAVATPLFFLAIAIYLLRRV